MNHLSMSNLTLAELNEFFITFDEKLGLIKLNVFTAMLVERKLP